MDERIVRDVGVVVVWLVIMAVLLARPKGYGD